MDKENKEKIGILSRVALSTGAIMFKDEPEIWYYSTNTAMNDVKADLKGKKVILRLADKKNTFSFISLSPDQPEKSPEEQGVMGEVEGPKEDPEKDKAEERMEMTINHRALDTALAAIKISQGSSQTALTEIQILDLAKGLAINNVLPFLKTSQKNKGVEKKDGH